jgi:hypothetical protein
LEKWIKEQSHSISQGFSAGGSIPILLPRLARIGGLPFMTPSVGRAKFVTSKPSIILSKPEPELDVSDEAILLASSKQPFASVGQLN